MQATQQENQCYMLLQQMERAAGEAEAQLARSQREAEARLAAEVAAACASAREQGALCQMHSNMLLLTSKNGKLISAGISSRSE